LTFKLYINRKARIHILVFLVVKCIIKKYNLSIEDTHKLQKNIMLTIRELKPEDNLKAVLTLCKDFFAENEEFHKEFLILIIFVMTTSPPAFWNL